MKYVLVKESFIGVDKNKKKYRVCVCIIIVAKQ